MNRRQYIKYFLYIFILIVIFFFAKIINFLKFFGYLKIADIHEFNEKNFLIINNREMIIRKNNEFFLIDLACPHESCLVKYNDNSFECPCHGSTFDYSGKVTRGPSKKNLSTVKLKIFNNEIYSKKL